MELSLEGEVFLDINLQAAKYFSENLLTSLEGEIARDYLDSRNISAQIQRIFGLGYSTPDWEGFVKFAKERKIDLNLANNLGLIEKKEKGGFYDKFRGRIIFPIFSTNGRVIAFGGRVFNGEEKVAKYLNSPESLIYSKRRSLYGLYHSKEEIRKLDRAILVEGYMDLIALYQHDIKNVVASSGTSLTDEQVKLLSRFTKNVIVLFDADIAGRKASLRSIEILLREDFDVKVVGLPLQEDPDSYINKFGKEKFEEILVNSKNFLEYQTQQFEQDGLFEDPAEQTKAVRELVKSASLVSDELKRSLLLKSISRKFNLRERLLETELNKVLSERKRIQTRRTSSEEGKKRRSGTNSDESIVNSSQNQIEREIILLLFEGDEKIINFIFDKITPEDFTNKHFRELAKIVNDSKNEGRFSSSQLLDEIKDESLKKYIGSLILGDESISSKWDDFSSTGKIEKNNLKHAFDLTKKISLRSLEDEISIVNDKINSSTDDSEIVELLRENKVLMERKKILFNENINTDNLEENQG